MKYISLLLCLAGVGLLIYSVGSYCGHGLPYQDSTPELLAVQRHQLETAKIMALAGAALFVVGGLTKFLSKRWRRDSIPSH